MNPEVRDKWLAALESGEIKQTRQYLGRSSGSRCCLGVLCDIAVEEGVIPAPAVKEDLTTGVKYLIYSGESAQLPPKVRKWAGLSDGDPFYKRDRFNNVTLATLNDSSKYNFKKIAEVIRKHF